MLAIYKNVTYGIILNILQSVNNDDCVNSVYMSAIYKNIAYAIIHNILYVCNTYITHRSNIQSQYKVL